MKAIFVLALAFLVPTGCAADFMKSRIAIKDADLMAVVGFLSRIQDFEITYAEVSKIEGRECAFLNSSIWSGTGHNFRSPCSFHSFQGDVDWMAFYEYAFQGFYHFV